MIKYKTPKNITILLKQFLVMHGSWQNSKLSQNPFVWQQILASHDSRSLNDEQQDILINDLKVKFLYLL